MTLKNSNIDNAANMYRPIFHHGLNSVPLMMWAKWPAFAKPIGGASDGQSVLDPGLRL